MNIPGADIWKKAVRTYDFGTKTVLYPVYDCIALDESADVENVRAESHAKFMTIVLAERATEEYTGNFRVQSGSYAGSCTECNIAPLDVLCQYCGRTIVPL